MTARTLLTRVACAMLFAAALAGCATRKQAPAPVIHTIAVIPAADPDWYTLQNRNAVTLLSPIANAAFMSDSHDKARTFTARMLAQKAGLGDELTRDAVDALTRQGYEARVLSPAELEGVDLHDIDYEHFRTVKADAVLHVYFSEVGVYSGMSTLSYLPKADITGYLFNPRDASSIDEEVIYYGVDGRQGTAWSVPADPRFAYASFEELISKTAELAAGFREGTRAAATRLAENLHKAVR